MESNCTLTKCNFELGIPVLQCTDDVVALRQSVRVIYPLFCEETALIDWPLIVNVKEGVDLSPSLIILLIITIIILLIITIIILLIILPQLIIIISTVIPSAITFYAIIFFSSIILRSGSFIFYTMITPFQNHDDMIIHMMIIWMRMPGQFDG